MATSSNDKITISVEDDGPGISPELRKHLARKQVDSKTGLGLGLFLSAKIIRNLGGRLLIRSATPKGAKFLLVFPKLKNEILAGEDS